VAVWIVHATLAGKVLTVHNTIAKRSVVRIDTGIKNGNSDSCPIQRVAVTIIRQSAHIVCAGCGGDVAQGNDFIVLSYKIDLIE
jgi:hypothetical protein